MSAQEKLQNIQEKNKSLICLGLDLDTKRMPLDFTKSIKGMYEFAMNIIDATKDLVCAYKPNMAFYENHGPDGLSLLGSITNRIPDDIPVILDGKRGDIGNTASHYAEALYEKFNADWVTLNPYMGYDTIRPFLEYKEKGVFILCLTSNSGSKDFQLVDVGGKPLYQLVAEKVDFWNKDDNCGLVVGATQPEQLKVLRGVAHDMPLLIPGVGAQGGSLEKAVIYGTDNFKKLAAINVSRSVLYASQNADYAERAREELEKLNSIVEKIRSGEITLESLSAPPPPEEPQSQTSVSYTIAQPETSSQPPTPPSPLTPPPVPPPPITPPLPQEPTPSHGEPQIENKPVEEKPAEIKEETPRPKPFMPKPPPPITPPLPQEPTPSHGEPQVENKPVEEKPAGIKEETPRPKPFMPKPPPPLPPRPDLMRKRDENRSHQQKNGSDQNSSNQKDEHNRNNHRNGDNF